MQEVHFREDNDERLRTAVLEVCTSFAEELQAREMILEHFSPAEAFVYNGSEVSRRHARGSCGWRLPLQRFRGAMPRYVAYLRNSLTC